MVGRHVTFNERDILNETSIIEIPNSEADIDNGQSEADADSDLDTSDDDFTDADESIDHGANGNGTGDNREKIHSVNNGGTGHNNIHSTVQDGTGNNNLRRSNRERKAPKRYGYDEYADYALSAEDFVDEDPKTMREAMKRPDWSHWKDAIDSEYDALMKNKTWSICELPLNRQAISCKWVFKLKRNAHGEIDKYKARLVARGFRKRKASILPKHIHQWQSW